VPTFGLGLWLDRGVETSLRLTRLAEKLGFQWIWYPDHYFLKDVYAVQAAAAIQTKRIKMGTAIVSPFLRHPTALASAVATIDDLSGGRAVLGLGSGGHEYPADLSLPISKPLTACKETIEICRRLWNGETVDYEGEVFKLHHARLRYATKRKIPVYLGARGTAMLQLAGRVCDGIITHGVTREFIDYMIGYLRMGADQAKRRMANIDVEVYTPVVAMKDEARAYNLAKPACILMVGGKHSGGEHYKQLISRLKLEEDKLTEIRSHMNQGEYDSAAKKITDEMVDSFCIVGKPDDCIEKVERLAKQGVTQIAMELPEYPGHLKLTETQLQSIIEGNAKHILNYFKRK
jgi:5,10-methylenetetrahydromethanopterin reductase